MTFEPNTVYRIETNQGWLWFQPRNGSFGYFRKGDIFCYVALETIRMRMPKGLSFPSGGSSKHRIILENGLPVILAIPLMARPPIEYVVDTAAKPE